MAYHFGRERRRGSDRRVPRDLPFTGIERRLAERRTAGPRRQRSWSAIIVLLLSLILLDAAVWHGFYRRAVFRGLNQQADSVRQWSDHAWDWKSDR